MSPTAVDAGAESNWLLASLPRDEYEGVLPDLQPLYLEHKRVLARPDESMTDVYFPRGAVISVLARMEDGQAVEGATIGPEGLAGLPIFLGDGSAHDEFICQIAGPAVRMAADRFRAAIERSPVLHAQLHRYALALMGQLIRTAGCNRVHPVDERCARWLLMTADRVGSDTFPLTQEFLAAMLGVRRPSVTVAAGLLQEAGLIRYRHGIVTIVDRERLEQSACEDYRLTRQIYERLYSRRQTASGT
jgi:CRP-like cAMP-binding protein